METKMVTIPFDLERAKKIQAEEHPGKIMTRFGEDVRILCFDAKFECPIIALVKGMDGREILYAYKNDGSHYDVCYMSNRDLVLQIPEWAQYKEGDVLTTSRGNIFILRDIVGDNVYTYLSLYLSFIKKGLEFDSERAFVRVEQIKGYSTDKQKQEIIDALKRSKDDRAKEYLKRFFGIKPECKFKPFQQVLVRNTEEERWVATFFSHCNSSKLYPFHTTGDCSYTRCIPYNEGTKHLVGTTDNWEEES